MSELSELFRCANIALAVTIPTLFAGGILLGNAGEAVLHAYVIAIVALGIALLLVLVRRNERHRRDQ